MCQQIQQYMKEVNHSNMKFVSIALLLFLKSKYMRERNHSGAKIAITIIKWEVHEDKKSFKCKSEFN